MNNINISNACFFTGHRFISANDRKILRNQIRTLCVNLTEEYSVTDFITGGALGFDTLAALTILELKNEYPGIKLHLFFPCTDQCAKWSVNAQKLWNDIKLRADDYAYITDTTYVPGCMQLRNKAMVDNAQYCIAYCTRNFGGTAATLDYAQKKGRNITVIPKL